MDQQTANARYAEIRKTETDEVEACSLLMKEGATMDQAADAAWAFVKKPAVKTSTGRHGAYTKSQKSWDRGFEAKHYGD